MTMSWKMFSAGRAGRTVLAGVFIAGLVLAGGCRGAPREHQYPEQVGGSEQHDPLGRSTSTDAQVGSLLDRDGMVGKLIKRDGEESTEPSGTEATEATEPAEESADPDGGGAAEEASGTEAREAAEPEESADPDGRAAAEEIADPDEGTESNEESGRDEESTREGKAEREQKVAERRKAEKLGVNGYLWRATLETLSFLPLSSADPYGGVIITDWRTNPQAPNERVKVTVYILDKRLRADGIRVSVFRQVLTPEGVWIDQPPGDQTRIQIEDAILTRARQLRVADIGED
jgi:hypothetical protein